MTGKADHSPGDHGPGDHGPGDHGPGDHSLGDQILIVAFLGAAPDEDAADVEQGVIEVNRALSSIGTLRPVETVASPDGTRGVDVAVVGAVCAAVLPYVSELRAALESLLAWAARRTGRTAKVVRPDGSHIELTGLSEEDQHLLVADWIKASSGR
jgi:hypothetical protein